ncbi:MAG: thioredoxin family protein [Methanomassiliicoccus sp.]|nr:thioredoxin family protein [Methanomassiliicoccus sp.]
MVVKIEVLGTGCSKCRRLEKNVKEAVDGTDIEVVKVTDINEISSRGAMMTPGLAIDGEIVALGRVPSVEEIKEMVEERQP